MYWSLYLLFLSGCLIEEGISKLAPDFIHPCKARDNICLKQSTIAAIPDFVKGLPDLGVPPLDPFYVDKILVPLPGLKVTFSNGYITGLKNSIIENINYNLEKRTLVMELHGNMTLKGAYTAVGRVLAFSIDGAGEAKIKMTNFKLKITLNIAIVPDKDEVRHFTAKSYKYTLDYGDKVSFNFTNLFKGNPELSNTVMTAVNENWRILITEFGKPVADFAVELVTRTIEKFFLAVPVDELTDGPFPS